MSKHEKLAGRKEYRKRIREFLILELGGKCEKCGQGNWSVLEFDHINGRDYEPSKLSSGARILRYREEVATGLIRLLCGPCNKGERVRLENGMFGKTGTKVEKTAEMPF